MRLHHLEVTAFGPFADTVSVDFDQLNDAGLFLLSGPTGAGKTSVLDAVCFALYGDVPGERSTARRLRSDHAAPGVAPRVVLEATLSGRRFRLTRSPSWERPKKRGTGTTTEQASVVLAERVDGAWQTLSTRLDETGHQVSALVGMNLRQFTQVAMLPQGRFQAFLRAKSEERHHLLQQLFRTGRFESVERWLRERRTTLRKASEGAHQQVCDLVSRISETTDEPLPQDWDVRDLTGPTGDGSLQEWVDLLRTGTDAERAATEATAASAAEAEHRARHGLDAGRVLAARQARLEAAAAERRTLAQAVDEHEARRRDLDAARRAAAVLPLHRVAERAGAVLSEAERAAASAVASAAPELGLLMAVVDDVDAAELATAERAARDASAQVRAALPDQGRLSAAEARVLALTERTDAAETELAALGTRLADLPALVTQARDGLERASATRAGLPALGAQVELWAARAGAHDAVEALEHRLATARTDLLAAQAEVAARRAAWLDVREARLDGMAAEIAGALRVGACCPVCGSEEHPRKATPAADAPDAVAEREALRVLDDAKAAELLHDEQVRDLTTQLALARERTGGVDRAQVGEELAAARTALAAAETDAARVPALESRLRAVEAEETRLGEERTALAARLAALGAERQAADAEVARLRGVVDGLLAGTGHRDLAALAGAHEERARLLGAALTAVERLAAARAARAEAEQTRATAVAEAGFGDLDEVLAAALEPSRLTALEAAVAEHERRLAAVDAVLAEEGAEETAAAPAPDLAALEQEHAAALAALTAARAAAGVAGSRARRLADLDAALAEALEAWAPLREELELATRVCAFAEGRSADNRLQMRLSAYVLAFRLSQVVAAANARLATMSDRRYALEHTGRRGAGETRGGLSLLVRDDWSGESRDPATLSGGETFVVSLALALGLADVITQEAGGADLDTLFVDEGFGSLDAETLDDVLDTLDSLRDGGRVVGVVSHVAEMRERIPTRLVVTKSRQGSTLAVTTPG